MAFWNSRRQRARARPIWQLASAGSGTLTCMLNQEEGARVTLIVAGEGSQVAACTHPTRRDAIAHAGFLFDRFTASGWQILSGMDTADGSRAAAANGAEMVPSTL
jgi:hypothetical protein